MKKYKNIKTDVVVEVADDKQMDLSVWQEVKKSTPKKEK